MPDITSSVEDLDASLLKKLSKFSHENEDKLWTRQRSSIDFRFTNCLKLDEEANNKNLADSQLRIKHMAIASLGRFYELEVECCILLPWSKIAEWSSNQSSGSEITLQLAQHFHQNLMGFALCAVLGSKSSRYLFDVHYQYTFEISTLSERKHVRRSCLG